ncbi:MAG TPA: 1-deoxy-D-xylulose-5-phosphate synthase N-terminal domain-containing protein [Rectinemataceae bacterium]|nr:1-deoxy-D-xylulose-5-phosphate synthase N-terminal domain-containing protein [Rectinemataceae bacterium]
MNEEAKKPGPKVIVATDFPEWEKVRDIVDNLMDVVFNYRQSGHPGGSRSKLPMFLSTLLGGVMRWDVRDPTRRFSDRFILGAGHTAPLVYCTLAVLNEAMRLKAAQTGDPRYRVLDADRRALYVEHLLGFRRRGGLSGHPEMQGRSLFIKANTGASGHGSPVAAGVAVALKRAGVGEVKVFVMEGEGGLTPGATHETMNSAWGLALDNLVFLIDWNDYGIDDHPASSVVYGTPQDWFGSHGWRVAGTEAGDDYDAIRSILLDTLQADNPGKVPTAFWAKTKKGRGYLKYDNASHGSPHAMNSELFWRTKADFAETYGAEFVNFKGAAPSGAAAIEAEFKDNLEAVIDVLRNDQALVDTLADRLLAIAESVPDELPGFRLGAKANPFLDGKLFDFENYPEELFAKPGEKRANREALGRWGAWVNALGARGYGRPLFIASSADLAGSTNIAGFGSPQGDFRGYGWYERCGTDEGALLPQEITEFANAGIMAGIASCNLSLSPEEEFTGFWGATSTYGAFSYLLYGPMRLFSQMSQDCELALGKVLWVAGHSGPETADDSRTHFGVFSPGVTQLFPEGQIINLHPWEFNEVPVVLAAAFRQKAPIVAIHLTRPAIAIPDRRKLGMPSHLQAARGAYIVCSPEPGKPRMGTVIVQGTSAMNAILSLLPDLNELGVKVVCAVSPQLFALQPLEYRESVLSDSDRLDSMVITTQARWLMHEWLFSKTSEEYSLSADWDNRWRTGGTLDEVLDEAHLTPDYIRESVERFVRDRPARLGRMRSALEKNLLP